MSQEIMDSELFSDFIVEAKEHLETIEPNLLELEKSPDNLALLNEIFRPMHSLKGASGFLGLNKMNHLAHKAENILDELRKGDMVITSEIMDVILSVTDALRQIINNLEQTSSEGDVETEHIIEFIDAIMNGEKIQGSSTQVEDKAIEDKHKDIPTISNNNVSETFIEIDGSEVQLDKEVYEEQYISVQDWIAACKLQEEYPLTSFGEGHLKDFISEALESTESLTAGLLVIEKDLTADSEIINDIFRYFHNLKGNSGIIGFQEVYNLTHEAETLLNKVRHGEQIITHELIDLLLFVVDIIESLVGKIESTTGKVHPFDISEVLVCLKAAVAGENISLPNALSQKENLKKDREVEKIEVQQLPLEENKKNSTSDREDEIAFVGNVLQQKSIIHAALETLSHDGNQKDAIDALHRALISIHKASNFIGLDELQLYADRTAGLVAQGRDSGIDFSLMLSILKQEIAIVNDMIDVALTSKELSPEELQLAMKGMQSLESLECVDDTLKEKAVSVPLSPVNHGESDKPRLAIHPENKSTTSSNLLENVSEKTVSNVTTFSAKTSESKPTVKTVSTGETHSEQKVSSTIRVDHEKLDHLMNLIGELIINRNRYTLLARHLEENGANADLTEVAQNLSETTYAMARISDDLQDTIMKVRMVPVSSVFSRFPRLVRDLSRKSGKEVELILEGEETELDKSIVEVIGDPLVHLIRNSVDHGIEIEAERIAKGKPIKGQVRLRAYHKGNSVAIEIEDDGKGLDPEKLKNVAVSKGILSPEDVKQLSDREAMDLIFAPGFSSAEKITDISGRGVGMDVVRTNIKSLKGSISISSEVGKGTCFTLSLPLTLAIIDALMVNVAGEMFAIPLDSVSETTKLEVSKLTDINGRKAVILRGEVLGLIELNELLNLPQEPRGEIFSVVIIHNNERRVGLIVDKLLERQEIVIKPLGSYLGDIQCISGATIMGDGSVILILDPHEIYALSTSVSKSTL